MIAHQTLLTIAKANLLDDAEAEMRYTGGLNYSYGFQFNWLNAQVVEQAGTLSEQDGHEVDMDFV